MIENLAPTRERQVSVYSQKRKSSLLSQNEHDVSQDVETHNNQRKTKKDVNMARIMKYSNPKWMNFVSLLISIIVSGAQPLFGLFMAEILFVMLNPYSETFEQDRNFWCGLLLLLAGLFGFFSWI